MSNINRSLEKANQFLNYQVLVLCDSLLDGLYLASSAVSYASDCHYANPVDASKMFQTCYTPSNLEWVIPEMLVFMIYASVAKMMLQKQDESKNTDDTSYKAWILGYIAWSWPYFRDMLSGLKNGRHAVVNIGILISQHAFLIFNPIGIAIGVLLALNLAYYRRMNESRRELYQQNKKLLADIEEKNNGLVSINIHKHSTTRCIFNYVSAGFDGITDGGYLYGCLITALVVCGVSGVSAGLPVIIASVVIVILMVASFMTKIHDEYISQRDFKISQIELELALPRDEKRKEELANELLKLKTPIYGLPDASSSLGGSLIYISYYLLRAVISGAKNSYAAFRSLEAIAANTILFVLLSVMQPICSLFYSLYLLIREACRGMIKHDSAYGLSRFRPLATDPPHSPRPYQPLP